MAKKKSLNAVLKRDIAEPSDNTAMGWGSDVAADMLRRIGVRYVTHNPGSSFRGLHDSLVNMLGNDDPTMLLCLNENQVISVAHGYGKVTGEPMACILHANVGLLNGAMGIFNAWADRVPVYIVGAGGPADAERRVPWINWLHTSRDQASYVRGITKWDDEPRSVGALIEAMYRANIIARTAPKGPVYICLDAALQEDALSEKVDLPSATRFLPADAPVPSPESLERAADLLISAKQPVLLMGRVSRNRADWDNRIRLAELLGAGVITDLKAAAAFPTDHPLHRSIGYHFRTAIDHVKSADVIMALDWIDLGSAMKMLPAGERQIVSASVDSYVHNAINMDCYGLSPCDLPFQVEPDILVRYLLPVIEKKLAGQSRSPLGAPLKSVARPAPIPGEAKLEDIGWALQDARSRYKITLMRTPLGTSPDVCHFTDPMDYLGNDGGAGVGSGPGNTIGCALGLLGSDRVAVGVIGDSDFIQGSTALWTAAHYGIAALLIVSNNRSHLNDELIQMRVAKQRGRQPANAWIGQRIEDPDVDIRKIAEGYGAEVIGPVKTTEALGTAIEKGLALVTSGRICVVDVHVAAGSPSRLAEYKPEREKAS
jgi:thiamine pyrophosphate-dependent acetolactate synthase large subunit-like protein